MEEDKEARVEGSGAIARNHSVVAGAGSVAARDICAVRFRGSPNGWYGFFGFRVVVALIPSGL